MGEQTYKYTTKKMQLQKVAGITLEPKGGTLSFRELKALKKDAYGASLLEKGLLVIEESEAASAAPVSTTTEETETEQKTAETIPDFEANLNNEG